MRTDRRPSARVTRHVESPVDLELSLDGVTAEHGALVREPICIIVRGEIYETLLNEDHARPRVAQVHEPDDLSSSTPVRESKAHALAVSPDENGAEHVIGFLGCFAARDVEVEATK